LHELNKKFSGNIPTQVRDCEEVLIHLLIFQHYSYFIVKYDFAEVDLHRIEVDFLARISLAANENVIYIFKLFNNGVHLNGINAFYACHLNPGQAPHFIFDFTKEFHSIPSIPEVRDDLQWVLKAYYKLRFYLIEINPIQ
jgi:D-alanyl-lipoteichoic acid acyltransferase DltB (MBOAT superfamily)